MRRETKIVYGIALVASVLISVTLSEWMESNAQQLVGPFQPTVSAPTRDTNVGMSPVVTNAVTSQLLVKSSAGNLYSAEATNHSSSAGFFVILDAAAIPSDGSISPKVCRALPANSSVVVDYSPGPPEIYTSGVIAVMTSAVSCYTKTSGAVSGFIKGRAQ